MELSFWSLLELWLLRVVVAGLVAALRVLQSTPTFGSPGTSPETRTGSCPQSGAREGPGASAPAPKTPWLEKRWAPASRLLSQRGPWRTHSLATRQEKAYSAWASGSGRFPPPKVTLFAQTSKHRSKKTAAKIYLINYLV